MDSIGNFQQRRSDAKAKTAKAIEAAYTADRQVLTIRILSYKEYLLTSIVRPGIAVERLYSSGETTGMPLKMIKKRCLSSTLKG
jgi:hypothetical protein